MREDYNSTYIVCVDDDNNILPYTFWIVRAIRERGILKHFEEYLRRTYLLTNEVLENLKPFRIENRFQWSQPETVLQVKTDNDLSLTFWEGFTPSQLSPDVIIVDRSRQLKIYFPDFKWINRNQ